jgi:hypothetical protein
MRKIAAPTKSTIITPTQIQSRGVISCAPSAAGHGHHRSGRRRHGRVPIWNNVYIQGQGVVLGVGDGRLRFSRTVASICAGSCASCLASIR